MQELIKDFKENKKLSNESRGTKVVKIGEVVNSNAPWHVRPLK